MKDFNAEHIIRYYSQRRVIGFHKQRVDLCHRKDGQTMMNRISLRMRIFLLLGLLVGVNILGALTTLWYAARTQNLYTYKVDQDVKAFTVADDLLTFLVMQKGYVTYFFLDGRISWIDQLNEYHENFLDRLNNARKANHIEAAQLILYDIESNYIRFANARDEVVRLYKEGKREEGYRKHQEVRKEFHAMYTLCEQYKGAFEQNIEDSRSDYKKTARLLTSIVWSTIPGCVLIGFLMAYVLYKQVLKPIREMALQGSVPNTPVRFVNEVKTLTDRVSSLVENVHQAQSKLAESQEHLVQSEKLALVGKMAAGVAHSVRNPLTSVKMRLFSLERSLSLNPTQKEDLQVISEEIRHIDTIVQNFLDFSRPPKLKFQLISPSDVVDMTLQLLRYRLESYGLTIELHRDEKLKPVKADTDQLKEVMSNLLLNALDVMSEGGRITITEKMQNYQQLGQVAVIRISDDGPGIPQNMLERVFEPFFSTKEEGSGLGLSIARRIIEEHGGQINLHSIEGQGTTFEILLPCEEN